MICSDDDLDTPVRYRILFFLFFPKVKKHELYYMVGTNKQKQSEAKEEGSTFKSQLSR
jgi:hypothetical protein